MEEESCSEESDRSSKQNDESSLGSGRSYECLFCRRGFTTAQALGGHMNIHRKDKAKAKPNLIIPPSSSKVDDEINYADLGLYSAIPTHLAPAGNYNYYSTASPFSSEIDYAGNNSNNYHHCQIYFPRAPSHCNEVLCEENQGDHGKLLGQDYWGQKNLSSYNNPLNKDKVEEEEDDNREEEEEGGLDLELRLGRRHHHHP